MHYQRPSMNEKRAQAEENRVARSAMWEAHRARNEAIAHQKTAAAQAAAQEDELLTALRGGQKLSSPTFL